MRRIIKEKDDIKVSIFSGDRLARVFIDSGYRNIAMVIADCGRLANGCYHIHHIEVVNMIGNIYLLCLTCSRMSIKNISKGMGLRKLLRIT